MTPEELCEILLKERIKALGQHEFPDPYNRLEEIAFKQGVYYALNWVKKNLEEFLDEI